VADFLRRHRGQPLCDDCITESLGLARRQEVHPVTTALGQTGDFVKDQDECSECGKKKLATRATR
jgi:hypothetical protein